MAPSARKKPHCTICHLPMEGHRRQARTLICPSAPSTSSTRSSLPDEGWEGDTPPQSTSSLQNGDDAYSQSSILSSPPPTPTRMSRLLSVAPVDGPTFQTHLIDDHTAHVSIGVPPPSSSQQGANPLRTSRNIPRHPSVQAYVPPFEMPPNGPWRRRNPNWQSYDELPAAPPPWTAPNPTKRPSGPGVYHAQGFRDTDSQASDEAPSEVPTVLVDDDGNTVLGSLDEDFNEPRQYHVSRRKPARANNNRVKVKQESGEDTDIEGPDHDDAVSLSSSLFNRIARTSSGVIRIVRGKHPSGGPEQQLGREQALEIAEQRARRRGVHTGLLHLHDDQQPPPSAAANSLKRASSWWMVLGRDQHAVQSIVRAQAQSQGPSRMPGTMDDLVVQNYPMMASFIQLVIAGVVGGCIVVYALSVMS